MNRKIVGILVVTLLISCILPNVVGFEKNKLVYKADQSQEDHDDASSIYGGGLAQKFIPTLPKLSKVQVLLNKSGGDQTCDKYYLAIKDAFTSEPLILAYIYGSAIVSTTPVWYDFDFPDIDVEKGSTYIIHVYGIDCLPSRTRVRWCYTDYDSYGYGRAYEDHDADGTFTWLNDKECDFAFITYGEDKKSKDNTFDTPFISFLENHPHIFPLLRQLLNL